MLRIVDRDLHRALSCCENTQDERVPRMICCHVPPRAMEEGRGSSAASITTKKTEARTSTREADEERLMAAQQVPGDVCLPAFVNSV